MQRPWPPRPLFWPLLFVLLQSKSPTQLVLHQIPIIAFKEFNYIWNLLCNLQVAKDFAFSLYELDWDVFGVHIEGAVNRVPCLEKIGIKSTVCGPESFTPDHKPILGEDPRVRGFFHGCGFNSGGMMFGKKRIKSISNLEILGKDDTVHYEE